MVKGNRGKAFVDFGPPNRFIRSQSIQRFFFFFDASFLPFFMFTTLFFVHFGPLPWDQVDKDVLSKTSMCFCISFCNSWTVYFFIRGAKSIGGSSRYQALPVFLPIRWTWVSGYNGLGQSWYGVQIVYIQITYRLYPLWKASQGAKQSLGVHHHKNKNVRFSCFWNVVNL